MNTNITLYRKRIIPEELISLKDDTIVYADNQRVITKWNTLKPRADIAYGFSAYLLDKGYKISKVYGHDDQLVYWYCDIISHTYDEAKEILVIEDLLVDIVITTDGQVKVLDLDELAEALEKGYLTSEMACDALQKTNSLLLYIYEGRFDEYKAIVEQYSK